MPDNPARLPWEESGWLDQVSEWIHAQLKECGCEPIGAFEIVHQRPWSVFIKIATDKGFVYFKAPAPQFPEAALTQVLSRWRPDCTPRLLSADLKRGWLLTADAGSTLRSLDQTPRQIDHWLKILPAYAEFQMEMAAHVPEMLALGAPDRRLTMLPQLYIRLMDDTANLRIGLEPGLTMNEFQRLKSLYPQISAWCEELAAMGLPETLAHEELHENNVLFNGSRYIYTDWSDSSIAHPFFSMLVTIRATAYWLKLPEDGAEMARMREAYLEPWQSFASASELMKAYRLAMPLAMLNRSLSWQYAIGALADKQKAEYLDSVCGWLQDFLGAI